MARTEEIKKRSENTAHLVWDSNNLPLVHYPLGKEEVN